MLNFIEQLNKSDANLDDIETILQMCNDSIKAIADILYINKLDNIDEKTISGIGSALLILSNISDILTKKIIEKVED